MKINLGASRNWIGKDWAVLDHKIDKTEDLRISGDIAKMDLANESCDLVFISHVLEHIPHIKLQDVMMEINRIMKIGAGIRILIPDLRRFAEAYVNNDSKFFEETKKEDESIRTDLGLGGQFMNYIVSPGQDTILLNRNATEFIAGYAHLYSYDFEMMKIILNNYGFGEIEQVEFTQSNYEDFKIPLHVSGFPKKWETLNNEFFKKNNLIHKYHKGTYEINFTVEGFDRDPLTSLIIEAKKTANFELNETTDFNHKNANNYNHYAFSLREDKYVNEKIDYLLKVSNKLDNPNFKQKLNNLLEE